MTKTVKFYQQCLVKDLHVNVKMQTYGAVRCLCWNRRQVRPCQGKVDALRHPSGRISQGVAEVKVCLRTPDFFFMRWALCSRVIPWPVSNKSGSLPAGSIRAAKPRSPNVPEIGPTVFSQRIVIRNVIAY